MARVARLAGAVLVETDDRYFLVGNTKVPCDFAASGFEPPPDIDALARPYLPLTRVGAVALQAPWLVLPLEGEPAAGLVAERFLIERNGSVSDRLWRLLTAPEGAEPPCEAVDARWLAEIPEPVWRIVRETVLRCT